MKQKHLSILAALAFAAPLACGESADPKADAETNNAQAPGGKGDNPNALPAFQDCTTGALPSDLREQDWEHTRSSIVAFGDAGHSAQDVLAVPTKPTTIPGKFAYGTASKDLEDEWIEVWMDNCQGGYTKLGEQKTDSDGRIGLDLAAKALPPVGRYGLWLRVKGDNTSTRSTLRVLPEGTKLMVFDIDATLTTDDMELFKDLLDDFFEPIAKGDYVPKARESALEITHRRRLEQGYQILYLTGRPYLLTDSSRQWLADGGFAPGTLHLTDSVSEIYPTEGSVGDYKLAYLKHVQDLGLEVVAAYGNATTDIYAYEKAGLDKKTTFILGKYGGESMTQALGDGYTQHLEEIAAEPAATQPYTE